MHQAIEAKEGVEIKDENQTLATITLQNYFRLYDKLSGMTGTAQTEAAEFHQIYKLGVVPIPTNRPMIRADQSDLIYKTEEAKFNAVVDDIAERHEKGQPVLVGTTSRREVRVPVAAARQARHPAQGAQRQVPRPGGDDRRPGRPQGRGHRRHQHGRPRHRHRARRQPRLPRRGASCASAASTRSSTPRSTAAALAAPRWRRPRRRSRPSPRRSSTLGGLYVLGTERHESRRIDNQLRGRSGRQGDPGESRFYLSLGDELMRRFKAQTVERVHDRLNLPDDVPIEAKMVTRAIKRAQTQVEQQNFEIRKNVLKYDEVLNQQRKVIYAERRRVLEGEDLHEQVAPHDRRRRSPPTSTARPPRATPRTGTSTSCGPRSSSSTRSGSTVDELEEAAGDRAGDLTAELLDASDQGRPTRVRRSARSSSAREVMRELERRVVLSVIDRKWREHLYEMDYLKEGIGLRAMAQRDPLVEYQREGFDMFTAMLEGIKEESVGFLFNLEVQVEQQVEEVPVEDAEPSAGQGRQDAVGGRGARRRASRDPRQGPGGPAAAGPAALLGADGGRRGRHRRGRLHQR